MRLYLLSLVIIVFLLPSCHQRDKTRSGSESFRIGVANYSHETCTFCPRSTGIEEWEYYGPPVTGDGVLGMGPYVEGFVDRCRELQGMELIGIYSPRGARGGSSGGWNTEESFDKYSQGMMVRFWIAIVLAI